MGEKNNLLENKKTNFMDGFKYEATSIALLVTKYAWNALCDNGTNNGNDNNKDLEIKNTLQAFLESGNKKKSVNIVSVNLIFKKLIEQNCIIGKETIKYLCDLCSENQKDDKNSLISENNLIPILLKTEYEHYDKENNNQGKPKIRKCILTNDLFEEIIEKIKKKEIGPDNIKHIFELVGNIVGGLFSTKNQIDEKKILDMIKQFGKENTLDVLCDFFIKGDLSVIITKLTFNVEGYHNLVPILTLKNFLSYGEFLDKITKTGAQSATINLIDFVKDIKTVYDQLISNQKEKLNEKGKLEWCGLHRKFIFLILNGILLNVTNKAPKEEKQEEEQKFVTSLSNKMEELLVGKEKNNKQEINIINNEVEENDDYDFISAMLQKIYNAVESVLRIDDETIGKLTVNKSADGDLEFVEVIEQGNILANAFSLFFGSYKPKKQKDPHKFKITDFLKAIWGKLEDKEKNHLKVLVLPIVFKMFGEKSWKKEILLHGLKLFGLENFDQINNKNLDSIFESAMKIIDNLPNDKDNDDQKKQKISDIIEKTKIIFKILLVDKNKDFDDLAQNLIDILLNDDLSQVEIIDKVKNILDLVKSNFVDENNLGVFKDFIKAFLNNGDFLLGIVNDVKKLKPLIENNEMKKEGSVNKDEEQNWFAPVLKNLGTFLINDIDNINDDKALVKDINKILDAYKNFAKSIDIPANVECCKNAFSKLEYNDKEDQLLEDEDSSILQKINAVESVREKYNALQNFCAGKDKLVHDQYENKDDFKKLEESYKDFMEEFNASNIILTEDEQKKFNEFRFTFEINQTEAVNSVTNILSTVKDILSGMPANKQQGNLEENLACVKELLKSVIKDGRILKFITESGKLKPIQPMLSDAFEQLAKLVEIKIDGIKNVDDFNKFITDNMHGLLNIYNKFAKALDADSKNNPDYQTNIIDSIIDMINFIEANFLIINNEESQKAYQELLTALFKNIDNKTESKTENEKKTSLLGSALNTTMSNIKELISFNQNDPDETNILTFVIDKIDDKAMPENSKRALKKSLICLMPLVQNSVGKENFKNNLFQLFDSYKSLAKELDKSFDFQAAKYFVDNQDIKNKYSGNEKLKSTFYDLRIAINALVPDTKKIMHKYKLLRNKIQEVSNTESKRFELTQEQKDIFEKFELDQSKAIPAIKNILISMSNFCPSDEEIKNENNIVNENDNGNDDILANINTDNKNTELNKDNEKPFNMVLINLLQGGDFLKDIINRIDSDENADMRSDLKNYLAKLSGPLCEFLISYLKQTKDTPQKIIIKFDCIMSKYLEITNIISAEKVDVAELFKSVEELLSYLEDTIVSNDTTIFQLYKDLFKNIVAQTDNGVNENIICLLAKTIKQNLTSEQLEETGKYLDFVDEYTAPIFTQVASLICESASDYNFFSKFISKFEKAYSIFNTKKSLAIAVKSLFTSDNENNSKTLKSDVNSSIANDNENQIFIYIFNMLEFEHPVNQIENKKINTTDNLAPQDNLINEDIIKLPLNNENIISTSSKLESNLINGENEKIKNDNNNHDEKIHLSETLFAQNDYSDQWFLKRWFNELKDFVKTKFAKKYFNALKKYIQGAKDDDEILETLKNRIDLTNPMGKYITFWRITNLLFWRESKWYYPVVVGEIILSLTIFLPFIVIAGLYSLGKYFWTWLFKKNDEPPIPPGDLPPQPENSQVQTSIFIDTGMNENNEKNKYKEILVLNNDNKGNNKNDIIITSNSENSVTKS